MSLFFDAETWIAIALVIAVVVWGLLPHKKQSDKTAGPTPPPPEDLTLARKVGVVTGVMGGSVEDAAITKYALSRLEKPPTAYDIGVAAGIESSVKPD
jgi:hypothetical protein